MVKRRQPKTAKVASTKSDLVDAYLTRLRAAGLRRPEFDAVFADLAADKAARKPELLSIASQYVRVPLRPRSRGDALKVIQKRFVELVRFEQKQAIA